MDETRYILHQHAEIKAHRKLQKKRKRNTEEAGLPPEEAPSSELSGQPTIQEMAEVLSSEDMELYWELWKAGKAYKRTRWAVDRGRQLSPEEQEQYKRDQASWTLCQQMERHVRDTLIATGRARPEMVERLRAARRRDVERKRAKDAEIHARLQELRKRLDDKVISKDELQEYHELATLVARRHQRAAQAQKRRRMEEKAAKEGRLTSTGDESEGDDEPKTRPFQTSQTALVQGSGKLWRAISSPRTWLPDAWSELETVPGRLFSRRMHRFRGFR